MGFSHALLAQFFFQLIQNKTRPVACQRVTLGARMKEMCGMLFYNARN